MSLDEAPPTSQHPNHTPASTAATAPAAPAPAPAPGQDTNKLALAGTVASIAPPVGLILAIAGLKRAKALGGTGRKLASTGIALSLVLAGLYGVGAYELGNSSASATAAADPGCTEVEAQATKQNVLSIDEQNLSSVAGPVSVNQVVYGEVVADDVKDLEQVITAAVAKSANDKVKSALNTVADDLSTVTSDAQAHPTSSYFSSDVDKLTADTYALNSLCDAGSTSR